MENPNDPTPPGARRIHVLGGGGKRAAATIKKILPQITDAEAIRAAGGGITFRRLARKVGRNELCPCGSGKKFKTCHDEPGKWEVVDPKDDRIPYTPPTMKRASGATIAAPAPGTSCAAGEPPEVTPE